MIINADVIDWAKSYSGQKYHALLCDPPYHLESIVKRFGKPDSAPAKTGVYSRFSKGFMGETWDGGGIAFQSNTWSALSEHLYPGAFGMAFAAARNFHRLATAIEDAGLIIHPAIFGWVYGSGFPRATRIKLPAPFWNRYRYGAQAMKPALEPIILFQKPYEGRPTDCIESTGAGVLDIDAGRIGETGGETHAGGFQDRFVGGKVANGGVKTDLTPRGRWPSNFILCNERSRNRLDLQAGTRASQFFYAVQDRLQESSPVYYCSKASTKERNAGLWDKNPHPTIKPLDLTRYLASLLLPPEHYAPRRLLVPFAGTGSEMIGAAIAGWDEITGIEMNPAYIDIAERRSRYWLPCDSNLL